MPNMHRSLPPARQPERAIDARRRHLSQAGRRRSSVLIPWLAVDTAPFVPPELGFAVAGAAEWNTAAMARYSDGKAAASGQPQLTSAAQFSDLRPGDWAYQALRNLVER